MGYSVRHETSNIRTFAFGKGAREPPSRAALQRRLRHAPMPDSPGERSRRVSPEDSRQSRMRLANGEERHPRLQRARTRRPHARLFAPQARVRHFRTRERRAVAADAPPLSEGVRARVELVDSGDGRRGRLRGGTDERARLGGDRSGDAFTPTWGSVDAGEALDHLPRPPVRKKKEGATD
jgi:hypothetical protein